MKKQTNACLVLENGARFRGSAFGYASGCAGELIFTASMVGYQEIMTDPANYGKIIVMTYPLMGNYGINPEDMESDRPYVKAVVTREACSEPNNWRCKTGLSGFMKRNHVVGIEGVDTRALTGMLRDEGSMNGAIVVGDETFQEELLKTGSFENRNAVYECGVKNKYTVGGEGRHIAVLDLGARKSLLGMLADKHYKLTVFPAGTGADEILSSGPDAVLLTDGPGYPEKKIVETVGVLLGKAPVAGIGLGYLALGAVLGCGVTKLKTGRYGGYPVKDCVTGKVRIAEQNCRYVIDSLPQDTSVTFVSINGGSVAGIANSAARAAGVQFCPDGETLDRLLNCGREC